MKKFVIVFLTASFILLLPSCNSKKEVTLSPDKWGEGELAKYLAMDARPFPSNPAAFGEKGAVTNTFHTAASRAGLEALKQGGTSVDAALTASLAQVTLNAGAVVSFFGIINMVHYDAASGKIVSMDATWNTVKNETDPMTIPGGMLYGGEGLYASREVSGRTALVGGFMRGVEAAHQHYGKLPFKTLFEPSIYLAKNGFTIDERTGDFFKRRDTQIRRLPETKATLVKADGSGYVPGDLFKQPALAATLDSIATRGVDYMYKGAWAAKAVAAVQKDGGKMTLEDLANYEVMWSEPVRQQYGAYELAVLGPPVNGSVNLIEALNLAEASGLFTKPHWSKSGESLRMMSDITNMFMLSFLPQATREMIYPGLNLTDSSRLRKETAAELWKRMEQGVKLAQYASVGPKHSDTVLAIDQWGNMTAITHSINTVTWGNEAIVVDGVSIGDAAWYQQAQIKLAGPGNRLPSPIEVGIILKDGKPIIPFASMSTGLHQQTVQSLVNIMAHNMDVEEAVNAPCILMPEADATVPTAPKWTVRVMEGAFPDSVLQQSGLPVKQIPASERRYTQGLWVGIYRDPQTGKLKAVSPPYATGTAFAY
ncbi:MAG: gamma-glutamyltransferase [Cyclobacteriaceae bacterium]|nr:gamma-glutamyltransferase [Cyclobacteriaceae bacterium]